MQNVLNGMVQLLFIDLLVCVILETNKQTKTTNKHSKPHETRNKCKDPLFSKRKM